MGYLGFIEDCSAELYIPQLVGREVWRRALEYQWFCLRFQRRAIAITTVADDFIEELYGTIVVAYDWRKASVYHCLCRGS